MDQYLGMCYAENFNFFKFSRFSLPLHGCSIVSVIIVLPFFFNPVFGMLAFDSYIGLFFEILLQVPDI